MAISDSMPEDPTGWMLNNSMSDFLLVSSKEIRYLCIFGYTFLHGHRVFSALDPNSPPSFKFVSLILACFGGGVFVPIFLNMLPVPIANDSLPLGVIVSFTIHNYFPIVRKFMNVSDILKVVFVVLFETLRGMVVTNFTVAAGETIPPSFFSFPLFGPIFCGTIAGCGGAFLPLNKGLDPIKKGLAPPMITAGIGATMLHLFLNTPFSDGCIDAKKKAHLLLTAFFIVAGLINALGLTAPKIKVESVKKMN
uniref:Uncharacterized protein n=1 Tax=Pseudictyota dubia TaxID=2749911 RepID=A0A6U2DME3_9STRA|mmetsp:Transcript_29809/g.55433  ORF Transcript_29809/g.55433 Transcript_29809/m.55433 type:complete len:251 (+) Transcript_29809:83-835(+)|eukprot:CAMPEP_0197433718 /NCGR_PEP_ID=MMETSP1175-20131217/1556_1 /TAXON_ID=1003142 /ORGANISM="Triceratium dubium, Strain CCMP147" /LENGTH=250 /DNA_ID=CAMNT_0042962191 /DNA_START=83 /DNA_END=835 /DNA_ORIENTATION=-